jgi:hypothetical protein
VYNKEQGVYETTLIRDLEDEDDADDAASDDED